jgi:hypothetical protein
MVFLIVKHKTNYSNDWKRKGKTAVELPGEGMSGRAGSEGRRVGKNCRSATMSTAVETLIYFLKPTQEKAT